MAEECDEKPPVGREEAIAWAGSLYKGRISVMEVWDGRRPVVQFTTAVGDLRDQRIVRSVVEYPRTAWAGVFTRGERRLLPPNNGIEDAYGEVPVCAPVLFLVERTWRHKSPPVYSEYCKLIIPTGEEKEQFLQRLDPHKIESLRYELQDQGVSDRVAQKLCAKRSLESARTAFRMAQRVGMIKGRKAPGFLRLMIDMRSLDTVRRILWEECGWEVRETRFLRDNLHGALLLLESDWRPLD